MKTDPTKPAFTASYDEIDGEIKTESHTGWNAAFARVFVGRWPTTRFEVEGRMAIIEFRSDRGHLALTVVSNSADHALRMLKRELAGFGIEM